MPLDVMKTRMMNAPPGTYNSLVDCLKDIMKVGPSGLFKGFIPAFIRLGQIVFAEDSPPSSPRSRLGPHTILMFIFLEQLKQRFGYLKTEQKQ